MTLGVTAGRTTVRRTGVPAPAPKDLAGLPDDLIVESLIGSGGMSYVYRARQVKLGRDVSLKVLPVDPADDPAYAERFLREARALAKLDHPNIVHIHDSGAGEGFLYILMEHVEGASLRDVIAEGRLSFTEVLRIVPELCAAIQYAHDRGIVHRDIKPENVLLDELGRVKVIDFGIARLPRGEAHITLTEEGAKLGTARYMAPEQHKASAPVDHRADIYALGVLMYELLTGEAPAADFQPPSRKANVDRRVDPIVRRTLRESPDERYQQIADVKRDLERLTRGGPGISFGAVLLTALLLGALALTSREVAYKALRRAAVAPPTASAPTSQPMPVFPPGSPADVLTSDEWEWTPPENLGPVVNSSDHDGQPCLSSDGLSLLFESHRLGGFGANDLWISIRKSPDAAWEQPENLGPLINTKGLELNPCLSTDGRELIFARYPADHGPPGLYISHRAAPTAASPSLPWEEPEPLGPEINNGQHIGGPHLASDGLTLWFHRTIPGGPSAIWFARRPAIGKPFAAAEQFQCPGGDPSPNQHNPITSSDECVLIWGVGIEHRDLHEPLRFRMAVRATPTSPFTAARYLGLALHAQSVDIAATLSADGRTLIFDSNREPGHGGQDLWISRRVRRAR